MRLRRVAPAEARASVGGDRPVGLHVEHEPVVVGGLLHPGGLDVEGDPPHRRIDRVDRYHADGRRHLLVLLRGHVAAPLGHGDVDGQPAGAVEGGDRRLRVEDLDVGMGLDVARHHVGGAAGVEPQRHRLVAHHDQHQVLEVQDDVGHVLGHAADGGELVQGAVEADLGDGRARDRRQQRAPQRVADRVAEAGLERADGELLPVAVGRFENLDGRALHYKHGTPRLFCVA